MPREDEDERLRAFRLLTGICFWTGLTPELSRAAKRRRLERIVRPLRDDPLTFFPTQNLSDLWFTLHWNCVLACHSVAGDA